MMITVFMSGCYPISVPAYVTIHLQKSAGVLAWEIANLKHCKPRQTDYRISPQITFEIHSVLHYPVQDKQLLNTSPVHLKQKGMEPLQNNFVTLKQSPQLHSCTITF